MDELLRIASMGFGNPVKSSDVNTNKAKLNMYLQFCIQFKGNTIFFTEQ